MWRDWPLAYLLIWPLQLIILVWRTYTTSWTNFRYASRSSASLLVWLHSAVWDLTNDHAFKSFSHCFRWICFLRSGMISFCWARWTISDCETWYGQAEPHVTRHWLLSTQLTRFSLISANAAFKMALSAEQFRKETQHENGDIYVVEEYFYIKFFSFIIQHIFLHKDA